MLQKVCVTVEKICLIEAEKIEVGNLLQLVSIIVLESHLTLPTRIPNKNKTHPWRDGISLFFGNLK